MQVFHTAGVPPNIGRIIFAIMGCTKNNKKALRKTVTDHTTAMQSSV
jgi:hypothetical protein